MKINHEDLSQFVLWDLKINLWLLLIVLNFKGKLKNLIHINVQEILYFVIHLYLR